MMAALPVDFLLGGAPLWGTPAWRDKMELLTIAEAARALNMTERAFRNRLHRGADLPPVLRLSERTLRVDRKSLDEWLARRPQLQPV